MAAIWIKSTNSHIMKDFEGSCVRWLASKIIITEYPGENRKRLIKFIITAAAPSTVPLPADNHARKPEIPEIIIPKRGTTRPRTEKTRDAMPKAIVIISISFKDRILIT